MSLFLGCAFSSFAGPATLPSGAVAWLKAENNANDSSGNTNNGIVDSLVTYAAGEVNNAFSFSGNVTNNVRIPNNPSLQTSLFSVEYWVYYNTAQNPVMVCKRSSTGAHPQPMSGDEMMKMPE